MVTTTMHPALTIPELCFAISTAGVLHKADIYSLTLVSRFWNDIAEVVLWESLDSLLPLMCLLPNDAWANNHQHPHFSLQRPLHPEDWDIFSTRANLVKRIYLRFDEISLRDQGWIVQSPPAASMLPQLHTLHVNGCANPEISANFLSLLFSPTTTMIKLQDISHWRILDWRPIFSQCPRVDHVAVDNWLLGKGNGSTHTVFCMSLLKALTTCEHLTRVRLSIDFRYGHDFVLALAACPALDDLIFALQGEEEDLPPTTLNIPYPSFPSLRSLYCFFGPMSLIHSIIASHHARPLTAIHVEGPLYTQGALVELLVAVKEHCDQGTLAEFHLEGECMAVNLRKTVTLRLDVLAPLAAFRALSHVTLLGMTDIELDSAACEEMAGWWPCLMEFNVGQTTTPVKTHCALSAVAFFARLCPQLARLRLPHIDASEVPDVQDGDAQPVKPSGKLRPLFELVLDDAPIADPEKVAKYLLHIFPAIKSAEYNAGGTADGWPENMGTYRDRVSRQRTEAWKQVNKIIQCSRYPQY